MTNANIHWPAKPAFYDRYSHRKDRTQTWIQHAVYPQRTIWSAKAAPSFQSNHTFVDQIELHGRNSSLCSKDGRGFDHLAIVANGWEHHHFKERNLIHVQQTWRCSCVHGATSPALDASVIRTRYT